MTDRDDTQHRSLVRADERRGERRVLVAMDRDEHARRLRVAGDAWKGRR